MNELRKNSIGEENNFEPKEGQREFLRSSKDSLRCPSFGIKNQNVLSPKRVEYLESFFRNIIRLEVEKYIKENNIKIYE